MVDLVLCLDKAEYFRKPTMCVKKLPSYVARFADLDLPVGTVDLHTFRLLDYIHVPSSGTKEGGGEIHLLLLCCLPACLPACLPPVFAFNLFKGSI